MYADVANAFFKNSRRFLKVVDLKSCLALWSFIFDETSFALMLSSLLTWERGWRQVVKECFFARRSGDEEHHHEKLEAGN